MVTRHCCRSRPRKVIVQNLPQSTILGPPDIRQSLVEAGNRATIHLFVHPVPAVYLDHSGLAAIEIRICARATECLSPVRGESLSMLRVEAVAERMSDNFVGHHSAMPRVSKTPQAVIATGRLEDTLHAAILTSPLEQNIK
jgi:hypothetical protein